MRLPHRLLVALAAACATAMHASAVARAQQTSYESLNVCDRVPAASVAAAVSGRPIEQRPVNVKGFTAARCVYGIEIGGVRRAFVVWVHPSADYDGLREASEPPRTEVNGVGDEAFATTDVETKRVQVTARKRGTVAVQVTSERLDWAEAVARVVLVKFGP